MRRLNLMVMIVLTVLLWCSSSYGALPRFMDLQDGTMLDTVSGLRWLKNANCFDVQDWNTALSSASNLASGRCGLGEGWVAGDWHLPSVGEWRTTIDTGYCYDSFILAGFSNVPPMGIFWAADEYNAAFAHTAIIMCPSETGNKVWWKNKPMGYVWPVRAIEAFVVIPNRKTMPNTVVTTTSASQTITILNNAGAALFVSGITLTGGDSGMFTLNTGNGANGTCGAQRGLAFGDRCTVSATFSPTSLGQKSTTLRIASGTVLKDVPLSGTSIPTYYPNVSWWRAENDARDSVGSNHGTLQGGVTYAAGPAGQAFSFDGSQAQEVAVPHSDTLNLATGHTVAFRVKFDAYPAAGKQYYLVNKWVTGAEDKLVTLDTHGKIGYFLFGLPGNPFVTSTASLQSGVWNQVVATYDGAFLKIYINGVLDAGAPAAGDVADSSGPLYFGYNPGRTAEGNEVYFKGQLDEVMWSNRALAADDVEILAGLLIFTPQTGMPRSSLIESKSITVAGIDSPASISITGGEYAVSTDKGATWGVWTGAAGTVHLNDQVRVCQTSSAGYATLTAATLTIGSVSGAFQVTTAAEGDPRADGLVAWWKGEFNAYDSVGGYHGALQGGATYAPGRAGEAFTLNGGDAFISTGYNQQAVTAYTVSAWIKTTDTSVGIGQAIVQNRGAGDGKSLTLGVGRTECGAGNVFFALDSDGTIIGRCAGSPINDGQWHHVVGVWSAPAGTPVAAEQFRIAIDGANRIIKPLSASGSAFSPLTGAGGLEIGHHGVWSTSFKGSIDEVEIFNRALDFTEDSKLGRVPDPFGFTAQTGVPQAALIASNPVTVTGITDSVGISITGGEYALSSDNGATWGGWTGTAGSIGINNQVKVRQTSSSSYNTLSTATLTIGGVSGAFTVTTLLPPPPTITVKTAALSADTGISGSDFVTMTAAQTISGTLSATLAAGEWVEVSYDNGTTWSTATAFAVGSTAWTAATTLAGSNTFLARVANAGGGSAAYSHAYTLDTTVPTAELSYSPAGPYKAGDSVTISATFSEALVDSPPPSLSLSGANNGLEPTAMAKVSATSYTYTHKVKAGSGTVKAELSIGRDLAGNIIATTPTVGATFLVTTPPSVITAFGPSNFAYIANSADNTVSVIDTATNTVTATIPVGASPAGVAVNPAETRVYVANQGSGSVSVIDTAFNTVVATVATGIGSTGIAVDSAGTRAYVAIGADHAVAVLDTASNAVLTTITVGTRPDKIAVHPDGTRVYVTDTQDKTVTVIDPALVNPVPAKENVINLTGTPGGIAVNPAGTRVYVANGSDSVTVIDTTTYTVIDTISKGLYWPNGVVVNPAGTRLYVANTNDTVTVIDTASDTVIDTIAVSGWPSAIALNPEGTRLYVTSRTANTVTVLDTAGSTVIGLPIPVGRMPQGQGKFVTQRAATLQQNSATSLRFTLFNANGFPLSGVAFADSLPAGLVVATPSGLSSSCGGTVTATEGAASVTLTGGDLAAYGPCTIALNVIGATAGLKANSVTVSATAAGTGNTDTASLMVLGPPAITSAASAHFTVGSAGSFTVTATGYPLPTLRIVGGSLPADVTFIDNGNGTATLGGTPAPGALGAYTFGIAAKNTAGTDGQKFALIVDPVSYTLSTVITGNGSVNNGDIACTGSPQQGTCSYPYPSGTEVMLQADVSNSRFSGWGDACAGCGSTLSCLVTVVAPKTCSAAFVDPQLVMVSGLSQLFDYLQTAYGAAGNSATLKAQEVTFIENLLLNVVGRTVTIKGGFEPTFTTQTGVTTIKGMLTIGGGGLVADRITIR